MKARLNLFSFLSSLFLLLFSLSASAQYIINGSFETPALSSGGFQYSPAGTSWTFTTGAGISSANSGFTGGAPEVPDGSQVAFLQNTGSISQTPYLSPGAVLTFLATQRVNYGFPNQGIQVLVNGVAQPIVLGSYNGASTVYSVTPPVDRYVEVAVKLSSVTVNNYYTVTIAGTNTTGDETVFIDTAAISTPSYHAYGFWDPSAAYATWRTDYPGPTTTPDYSTNYLWPCPDSHAKCYPAATWTQTNWYSSSDYVQTNPHWIVGNNQEPYINSTTCSPGPPDMSVPLQPAGGIGSRFAIYPSTSSQYPSIGNYNVMQLIYSARGYDGCIPYLSFAADHRHGNGKPLAIMDAAGNYRPHLSFSESVISADSSSAATAYLVLTIGGYNDNVDRMLFVMLGIQNFLPAPDVAWEHWNFPIKNSQYYPGGILAYIPAGTAQARCGISSTSLPVLSFTNQFLASGQSPSSISNYNIDLYQLIHCIAGETDGSGLSGWNGVANQLPDPIVITHVEWALETIEATNAPPNLWYAFWNPQIN